MNEELCVDPQTRKEVVESDWAISRHSSSQLTFALHGSD
jgi:hypothetical protein